MLDNTSYVINNIIFLSDYYNKSYDVFYTEIQE
jgi:hypothetical protein